MSLDTDPPRRRRACPPDRGRACDRGSVTVTRLPPRPAVVPRGHPAPPGTGSIGTPATIAYILVSAVLRGVAAALAGLVLLGGLALLVWAITPTTGSHAGGLLRSSTVVYAAGHFLPVTVAGTALTIRPLAVSLIAVLVVASAASRGKAVRGRTVEAVHGLVLAVAYAATVDLVARYLVPSQDVQLTAAPLLVACLGVVLGLATHRTAWNRWWRRAAPRFLRAGVRGGVAAVCILLAAGAAAVAVGLAASFRDAVQVNGLVAPGPGDGFGLALLSLAFLPNAVVAGLGYLSGAGFVIGAGSYSPFGSAPVELPAIPVLTAAPDAQASSPGGLVMLAVPVLAGIVVALWIDRRLGLRWQRMAAAAIASGFTGLVVAGLAAAARGGVAGGPWASTGVPPLLAGGAVGGVLALVSLAWTGVAGLAGVPWRAVPESAGIRQAAGSGGVAAATDGSVGGSVPRSATGAEASALDTGTEAAGDAATGEATDASDDLAGDAAGVPEAYEITALGAVQAGDAVAAGDEVPAEGDDAGPEDGEASLVDGAESGPDGVDVGEEAGGSVAEPTDSTVEDVADDLADGQTPCPADDPADAQPDDEIEAEPLSSPAAASDDPEPDADQEFPASPDEGDPAGPASPSAARAAGGDVRAG